MSKFILSGFGDEIDESLSVQLDVLSSLGISHLEARGIDGKNVSELTLAEAKEAKKKLDDKGFKLSSLASPIGKYPIEKDFEPELSLFKHCLEIADVLESPFIRMFSFFIEKENNPDDFKEEVFLRYRGYLDAAQGHKNITLLHENEHAIFGDIARRNYELMTALNTPKLRLIFDPSNYVLDGENTLEAYELVKDFVIYFHIKDSILSENRVVEPGKGEGNIEKILKQAWDSGYEGFVSLEPHLGVFGGLAAIEKNLDLDKMEQSGPNLFIKAHTCLMGMIKNINGGLVE